MRGIIPRLWTSIAWSETMDLPYDERQTLFSRVRLKAGSNRYRAFYARWPQLQKADDAVRGMDILAASGESKPRQQALKDHIDGVDARVRALYAHPPALRPLQRLDAIREVALSAGAVDAGVALLSTRDYYQRFGGVGENLGRDTYGEETPRHYSRALVFAVEMRLAYMLRAPRAEVLYESKRAYEAVARIGATVASRLQASGYEAAFASEDYYLTPMVPLARKAGLGEIGMTNHLVHPDCGNRIRLGAVYTTAPLIPDEPREYGIRTFCRRCALCLMNCPSRAIKPYTRRRQGTAFFQFDEHACFRMFKALGTDCSICIVSCPYTHGIDRRMQRWMADDRERMDAVLKKHLHTHGRRPRVKTPLPLECEGGW